MRFEVTTQPYVTATTPDGRVTVIPGHVYPGAPPTFFTPANVQEALSRALGVRVQAQMMGSSPQALAGQATQAPGGARY